jgi:DNA-binding beta-propeller fold protein YncE
VGRNIVAALGAALVLVAAEAASASHPQIPVGGFPTGIALSPETDTIYVGNGNTGTLSLSTGGAATPSRRAAAASA